MKIAVLSDIHGNIPALEEAAAHIEQWRPDQVIVNGDVINRGPCSRASLRFVLKQQKEAGWRPLRGNHEEYVLACDVENSAARGPAFELVRFAHWTCNQLNGELTAVRQWPAIFQWRAPDNSEFCVTHASTVNNRDGIYPRTTDEELRRKIAPQSAVFVTSHTHVPLIRTIDGTTVVNIGSVGAPFDQDRRLSYGQFTWTRRRGWQAEIVRLPYDYAQIERDYVRSGFLQEAGPLAQLMLVELRKARGLVYRWANQYQDAVLAGEIGMEASVRDILRQDDVRPFTGAPGWQVAANVTAGQSAG